MSLSLELNRLAIHYVDRNTESPVYASREQDIAALDPTIVEFMTSLVFEVWDAPDTGSTRSARFVSDDHERLGPSVAKNYMAQILEGSEFFGASKELARHLYQRSHPKASPGVLAVVRFLRSDTGTPFVATLKIRHRDETFVRVLSDALTQLEVEQVENMLLRDIQKGAITPHPHRDDYDLKVVDKQATDDPAVYFTESFLGCLTKKSDEYQVKNLVSEIQNYARARGLSVAVEKLSQVIAGLREQDEDVTTSVLTEAVQAAGIYDHGFQPDDFQAYIEQQSRLGPLDIPRERFTRRGKEARRPRKIEYRFHDPEFSGMILSGPPETIGRILSVQGDSFTFVIRTTRDGFNVHYR